MVGAMIYDGISTWNYGAVITDYSGASPPERDSESIEVPGRNGNILLDGGRYKNVEVTYSLYFHDGRQVIRYRADMGRRTGYFRLENSFEPHEYRLARIKDGIQADMIGIHNRRAQAVVKFDCKPQRFLTDGDYPLEFTASDERALWNPCPMTAKPLIRVYGSGTVGVGECTVTVGEHEGDYVDIDSDIQDCFCGTLNLNKDVSFSGTEFPELREGATGISLGSGIEKVIVYPRWWTL